MGINVYAAAFLADFMPGKKPDISRKTVAILILNVKITNKKD
jgi:hypothetical protein